MDVTSYARVYCGDIYRRVHWNNRGYKSIVWRCVSRLEEKGSECTAPTINEETLQIAVVKAINDLLAKKNPSSQPCRMDVLLIVNLSRLGRDTVKTMDFIRRLNDRGIKIYSPKEGEIRLEAPRKICSQITSTLGEYSDTSGQ